MGLEVNRTTQFWAMSVPPGKISRLHSFVVDFVSSLSFSSDEQLLAVGTMNEVRVCNVQDGAVVGVLGGVGKGMAEQVVLRNNGEVVIAWGLAGVEEYSSRGILQKRIQLHDGRSARLSVISRDCRIAATDCSASVVFRDTQNGDVLGEIGCDEDSLADMRFFPKGDRLAVVWRRGDIGVYSVPEGKSVWLKSGHARCVDISRDGRFLVVGGYDKRLV